MNALLYAVYTHFAQFNVFYFITNKFVNHFYYQIKAYNNKNTLIISSYLGFSLTVRKK